MATGTTNVYQFKITLKGIKPPIWRRIQVPEKYNFFELHIAIQRAMGWKSIIGNYHLHQFEMINPRTSTKVNIGIPDDSGFVIPFSEPVIEGKRTKISNYFSLTNKKAKYEYDFGDGWEHEVQLESILPAVAGKKYPLCVDGKRACPPEDCGGTYGYVELLKILADPNHSEYKERVEWLEMTNGAAEFHAEEFDPRCVY